jgi:hypothetical protein
MEYDGNTQKGVARKNVVLTDPKQTIKTDVLYYDRLAIRLTSIPVEPLPTAREM